MLFLGVIVMIVLFTGLIVWMVIADRDKIRKPHLEGFEVSEEVAYRPLGAKVVSSGDAGGKDTE